MPWVRFDDQFLDNPKIAANLSPLGIALHFAGIVWSARNLTDGIIPNRVVPRLLNFDGIGVGGDLPAEQGAEYVQAFRFGGWYVVNTELGADHADVWHDADSAAACPSAKCRDAPRPRENELLIHDYLVYQPSKADVMEERRKGADRVRAYRERRNAVTDTVTNGDVSATPVPVPVPVTRVPEREVQNLKAPAAVAATVENVENPNPFGLNEHQLGLIGMLLDRYPSWAKGRGALTVKGVRSLQRRYGVEALSEGLEELYDRAGDVERPYPWLAEVTADHARNEGYGTG